jgi:hypothetical protein
MTASEVLRPPYDRSVLPASMQHLPVDTRGYPIPWFVDMNAPYVNGNPDFRVMDGRRFKLAIRERRCWVCGYKAERPLTFVAGPMCGINRTSSEPPCHLACAIWAARACPFLSMPKRIRDERNLPPQLKQAGIGIKRNPGVTMLWTTKGYSTFKHNGVLFDIGEPESVEWYSQGRIAQRGEVMESVLTGIPLLVDQCKLDPDPGAAVAELRRLIARFMPYLPESETVA